MEAWDVVKRTGLKLRKDERVVLLNGEVVVERKAIERDVTDECTAEIRKSKSSEGYYIALVHEGKAIIAFGLDENSKYIIRSNGYRLEKSPDGHVSFRIKSTRT
jgi:hypothetical protein